MSWYDAQAFISTELNAGVTPPFSYDIQSTRGTIRIVVFFEPSHGRVILGESRSGPTLNFAPVGTCPTCGR
jgi:hypothetical protein